MVLLLCIKVKYSIKAVSSKIVNGHLFITAVNFICKNLAFINWRAGFMSMATYICHYQALMASINLNSYVCSPWGTYVALEIASASLGAKDAFKFILYGHNSG